MTNNPRANEEHIKFDHVCIPLISSYKPLLGCWFCPLPSRKAVYLTSFGPYNMMSQQIFSRMDRTLS